MDGKKVVRPNPGTPFVKGDPRAGRPKGTLNKASIEVKELARSLLSDPGYVANLKARLIAGECPPPVETMLWHYAYGKPKESVELTTGDGPLNIIINGVMPMPPELVGENTTTTADSLMTYRKEET
jgi:hypothetical protein